MVRAAARPEQERDRRRRRRLVERFNCSYTSLLRRLHGVFNGEPHRLRKAFDLMIEMRLLAASIVETPVIGTPYTAAPTFEYTPLEQ